jgi:excisionase family DNA binding protein
MTVTQAIVDRGQTPAIDTTTLLTMAEAATHLRVPENWLRKKVSAGAVPCTRIGRHVRFTVAQVEEIIVGGEQRPLSVTSSSGVSRRARRSRSAS